MRWQRTNWTDEEITQLTSLWGTIPAWEIGQQLHRPEGSVRNKARRLHLPLIGKDLRLALQVKRPRSIPTEKGMRDDEESRTWCAYWLARRQARLARCGGHAWSA